MKQKEKSERMLFAHLTTCIRTQLDNESRMETWLKEDNINFKFKTYWIISSLCEVSKQVLVIFNKTIVQFQDAVSCCIEI